MQGRNDLANRLRKNLLPVIDDPRRKFLAKVKKESLGNLGEFAGALVKKPKAKRNGVRTGRPVSTGRP